MAGGVRTNKSSNPESQASKLLALATAEIKKKQYRNKQMLEEEGGRRRKRQRIVLIFIVIYRKLQDRVDSDFKICHRLRRFE